MPTPAFLLMVDLDCEIKNVPVATFSERPSGEQIMQALKDFSDAEIAKWGEEDGLSCFLIDAVLDDTRIIEIPYYPKASL